MWTSSLIVTHLGRIHTRRLGNFGLEGYDMYFLALLSMVAFVQPWGNAFYDHYFPTTLVIPMSACYYSKLRNVITSFFGVRRLLAKVQ